MLERAQIVVVLRGLHERDGRVVEVADEAVKEDRLGAMVCIK
jgi:hypothetical protein